MNEPDVSPKRSYSDHLSEFMQFLAGQVHDNADHLPTLAELSDQLEVSIATLREQLEVARALGLVEVKPRSGMRPLPYSFRPAVQRSLDYALTIDPAYFQTYSDLRSHLEAAFWYQAVARLTQADLDNMRDLVERAKVKLHGQPVQIPHTEHRELHLAIYRRLDNPFVFGLLEVYWNLYEAFGLNVFTDYPYLERVWQYHECMVDAIRQGDYRAGYQALMDHMDLLSQRPDRNDPTSKQRFE
jgi:DNA-binding FadR family transcriptional regulator